jgi:hypothetical protein
MASSVCKMHGVTETGSFSIIECKKEKELYSVTPIK